MKNHLIVLLMLFTLPLCAQKLKVPKEYKVPNDTCITKGYFNELKYNIGVLLDANSVMQQEIILQHNLIMEKTDQIVNLQKIGDLERDMRIEAEKNMFMLQRRSEMLDKQLKRARKNRWFYMGAGAVVAGTLINIILK